MEAKGLHVRMLGNFSIELGEKKIDDNRNRSRKVWLLLAYMIYYRNRQINQDELTGLLWGEEESSSNPANALKTMFHRVRSMLDELGESMGHTLIIRSKGGYAWNTELPLQFDVEIFDELCRHAAIAEGKERLERYLEAVELYDSDFLVKLSTEPWVLPIATYYHNLYIHAVQEAILLLEVLGRREEAIRLCRKAVTIEPYNEDLYRHLMRNLVDTKDQRGAIMAYEEMSELLFSNFGVMPAEDIRALYREAIRVTNDRAISPGVVREQLRETELQAGALFCEYDFFKVLYHAEARGIARRGSAVHIGLLSVQGADGKELSKRSLTRAMENLQDQIRVNLRRGDVAAQCSVSQYILMLQQSNYENSRMVCQRIVKSFYRQFPHSPTTLDFSVQPMEPTD